MSFNSDTYHANKWSRKALAEIAEARTIKDRIDAGVAYEWEKPRVAVLVKLARGSMRVARTYRRLKEGA